MIKIIFLSGFPLMIHGIGSYTKYLVDALCEKDCDCGVISFDPNACEFPIMKEKKVECDYLVLYTIPSCYDYNFNLIFDSLTNLYKNGDNYVFWIQQGDSFWRNRLKFVEMLKFFKKFQVVGEPRIRGDTIKDNNFGIHLTRKYPDIIVK